MTSGDYEASKTCRKALGRRGGCGVVQDSRVGPLHILAVGEGGRGRRTSAGVLRVEVERRVQMMVMLRLRWLRLVGMKISWRAGGRLLTLALVGALRVEQGQW